MLSPRASSTLKNVTRNLFARQAIQNGEARETPRQNGPASGQVPRDDAFHEAPTPPLPPLPPLEPRGDALVIEPEPPIQVPDAADEAPRANQTVTFALDLPNSLVAAAPGVKSMTSKIKSTQGSTTANTKGPSTKSKKGNGANVSSVSNLRRSRRKTTSSKRY